MILIYESLVDAETYAKNGYANDFPMAERCPACHAIGRLYRHGFYERSALPEVVDKIPICRLQCPSCRKTFSLIPDFLIPYFQFTLKHILIHIESGLHKRRVEASRQRVAFYLMRFFLQLNWIFLFFSDKEERLSLKVTLVEQAFLCLNKILSFGDRVFLRRSAGYVSRYFLSRSLVRNIPCDFAQIDST